MFWKKKKEEQEQQEPQQEQKEQEFSPIIEKHLGGWVKSEETKTNICTSLTPEGEKYLESLKTLSEVFVALKAIHHTSDIRIVANLANGGGQVVPAKPVSAYKIFVQHLENKLEEIIKTDPEAVKVLQKNW